LLKDSATGWCQSIAEAIIFSMEVFSFPIMDVRETIVDFNVDNELAVLHICPRTLRERERERERERTCYTSQSVVSPSLLPLQTNSDR
jgi:hypothetical protein